MLEFCMRIFFAEHAAAADPLHRFCGEKFQTGFSKCRQAITMNNSDKSSPILNAPNSAYWRTKLNAFMHDNPGKPYDIMNHEERARELKKIDQFEENEIFFKEADFGAAAADRLPFPHAGKLKVDFRSATPAFIHPLCDDEEARRPFRKQTADQIDEISQGNRPILDEGDARAAFIARWRFWKAWCVERNASLAYLPADTRIPDHTIWNHLGITSAFQGCMELDPNKQSALLLFSIGPVQSFIAAARNIRDLWSGSYLLSYLVSHGLRVIAENLGPDHLLFPNVWNQPLMDLQLREIYIQSKTVEESNRSLWDEVWHDTNFGRQSFLLPSLPNRFLVLVPANRGEEIASKVEEGIRSALCGIAESVADHLERKLERSGHERLDAERFDRQIKDFLEVYWQLQPAPESVEGILSLAKEFLPDAPDQPHASIATLERMQILWQSMPKGDQTSYGMLNPNVGWAALTAINAWGLDAIKSTRKFAAWNQQSSWSYGRNENKDSLTGKEEAVLAAPPDKADAKNLSIALSDGNPNLLRANERLGAMTLIKRFWHLAYLSKLPLLSFRRGDFAMPDLHQLSVGQAFGTTIKDEDPEMDNEEQEPQGDIEGAYYAVLVLDGDEMGKWISGAKLPSVRSRMAPGAVNYFDSCAPTDEAKRRVNEFLEGTRPLNPSFHLQFSEALGNFGQYAVRRIVESHDGRLIYSGGDDVLAMMPAAQALSCASALRAAFQGNFDGLKSVCGAWHNGNRVASEVQLFARAPAGFIRLNPELQARGLAGTNEPITWDAIVPGPAADVSVGVAIGHYKAPLQDLIRAAQRAEKRAKTELGRSAVAIEIIKRSGEQVSWGTRWGDGKSIALLHKLLSSHQEDDGLSGRFAYKLLERLLPYLPMDSATNAEPALSPAFAAVLGEVMRKEFTEVLEREEGAAKKDASLNQAFEEYMSELQQQATTPLEQLRHFTGLLKTLAWVQKSRQQTS